MGATCCKAATQKQQPHVAPLGWPGSSVACTGRNITRHSPSWSFRWDHRTHIEDDLVHSGESARYSHDNRSGTDFFCSENGSPGASTAEAKSRKPSLENMNDSLKSKVGPLADQSMVSSSSSPEIKELSNASTSAPGVGLTPSDMEPSKRTRRSPGYTLYRQVSDSRIPSLKSSFNSLSNISRSPDPLHSLSNNSSDGWSMHIFSQLVGSISQRDMGSSFNSSTVMINQTPSQELQSCKICSRFLNERSLFSAQKIISAREYPSIAVLACGHVYHADCLESVTIDVDQYEPNCPICSYGEKFGAKFVGKCKISKNAVVDLDVETGSYGSPGTHKGIGSSKGKGPKRSSSRPFLKRHFSLGSSQPETERKTWFWGRYRKD